MNDDAARILQRFMDEVWNDRRLDLFDKHVSPNVKLHPLRGEGTRDFAQYRAMAAAFQGAFSDLRFETLTIFGSGDRAAARIVITGTNDGPWNGRPATGKKVRAFGHPICRVENGQIAEFWQLFDEHAMLQQTGHVPS